MALFYGDMISFWSRMLAKLRPKMMSPGGWPLTERRWDDMTEDEQTAIRVEFDQMLCELGRHDYEGVNSFVDDGDTQTYDLKCFHCGAIKGVTQTNDNFKRWRDGKKRG